MRLSKLLAREGYMRKQADAVIAAGRVQVDGLTVRDGGAIVDADAAQVTLDGVIIGAPEHLHIMMYKPAGVVTATEDARHRTVADLLPEALRRRELGPVGRLDKDVTGLVLLTTDGQLAHRLISPRWKQAKRYLAEVSGEVGENATLAFARGMDLSDFTAKPALLTVLEAGPVSRCRVEISEGKFHQVKRMFAAIGHPVISLHREAIAGLSLDTALAPGEARTLTEGETATLYQAVNLAYPPD